MNPMQEQSTHNSNQPTVTGVLMVNLGTPSAPTTSSVRRYLAEFLSDPRVVQLPRLLWLPILWGVILWIRPSKSAKAYQKVWSDQGSPLLVFSQNQARALQDYLSAQKPNQYVVELAMRYGAPSIAKSLARLRRLRLNRLIILPMYPQYSSTTTASVYDAVADSLDEWADLPEVILIEHYFDDDGYISALADSIRQHWDTNGRSQKLLFSFHGIPKRYVDAGDSYYAECLESARLLAIQLKLSEEQWAVVFQSRFGREEWLRPYIDEVLRKLPSSGVNNIDVVCPGFSADCLETLEEIAMQDKKLFIDAGGKEYRYISALNDRSEHIAALAELVMKGGKRDHDKESSQMSGAKPSDQRLVERNNFFKRIVKSKRK